MIPPGALEAQLDTRAMDLPTASGRGAASDGSWSDKVDSHDEPEAWEKVAVAGFAILGFGLFLVSVFPSDVLCVPVGIMLAGGLGLIFFANAGRLFSGADSTTGKGLTDFYFEEVDADPTLERDIDEIVRRVKSTIKVRCRYCGTLNEESANSCESCGAPM